MLGQLFFKEAINPSDGSVAKYRVSLSSLFINICVNFPVPAPSSKTSYLTSPLSTEIYKYIIINSIRPDQYLCNVIFLNYIISQKIRK